MTDKINCDYCNKLICKSKLNRHQNSKECKNKQLNKDIILPIKEYKCKYCNKKFNRVDKQNEHELICDAKEIYFELQQIKKENELLKDTIKQKDNDINYFKNQLQIYRPNININHDNSNVTNNITINNNININFSDIRNHLDK